MFVLLMLMEEQNGSTMHINFSLMHLFPLKIEVKNMFGYINNLRPIKVIVIQDKLSTCFIFTMNIYEEAEMY